MGMPRPRVGGVAPTPDGIRPDIDGVDINFS